METSYFVVNAAGAPLLKGTDKLERGGFYRLHSLIGHGLLTEAEFREFASSLNRPDLGTIPAADAPLEELVAWANKVGWRVLALLGENLYQEPDENEIRIARRGML